MDWYTVLFATRWVIITLFYFVLLVLVIGVYREASMRLGKGSERPVMSYGRLRVIHPGADKQLPAGSILDLKMVTSLGTAADNDIVLGDQFVSAHHFRLRWDGAVWWLEDLHSKNGTQVNRQPCLPDHPQELPKGALITAGDMVMEIIE
ncbi:MAG: FHA domain-containing protein [Acidobacteriaceae bacterium]